MGNILADHCILVHAGPCSMPHPNSRSAAVNNYPYVLDRRWKYIRFVVLCVPTSICCLAGRCVFAYTFVLGLIRNSREMPACALASVPVSEPSDSHAVPRPAVCNHDGPVHLPDRVLCEVKAKRKIVRGVCRCSALWKTSNWDLLTRVTVDSAWWCNILQHQLDTQ